MFDSATQAQLQERRGVHCEALVWFTARNRETGNAESVGFWTGDDIRVLIVEGQARTYYPMVMHVPPIVTEVGLTVRYHRVILPPLTDEVRQALRVYDIRYAQAEIHAQPFDIDTGVARTPVRKARGRIENAPEVVQQGGATRTDIRIVSEARRLTQPVSVFRSDAETRRRSGSDTFRKYVGVVEEWRVRWDTR